MTDQQVKRLMSQDGLEDDWVPRIRITYIDGGEALANINRPAAKKAFRQAHDGRDADTNDEDDMYWLCWVSVGRPGDDYDSWIDTIEDLDPVQVPRGKAQTPAGSQN